MKIEKGKSTLIEGIDQLVLDPVLEAQKPIGQATWDYFHPTKPKQRIRVVKPKDPVYAKQNIDISTQGIHMDNVALIPVGIGDFAVEGESILKPLCWQNSSLKISRSLDRTKGEIIFNSAKVPKEFDFRVEMPLGCRLDGNKILNEDGSLRSWIPGAYMVDGSNDSEMEYGKVGFEQVGGSVVRFTPDLDWLTAPERKFPVVLDPSVTRQGSSYIEDNHLYERAAGDRGRLNYGGGTGLGVGSTDATSYKHHVILRLDETSIPAGNIISAILYLYAYYVTYGGGANYYHRCYRIKEGNDWVEGTANGAIQAGSSCYDYCKYSSQGWLGGPDGCGDSGVDHDVWQAGDPEYYLPGLSVGWKDFNFRTDWLEDWRDGVHDNEGIVIIESVVQKKTYIGYYSTEYTTDPDLQPYFYIEYEPISSGGRRLVSTGMNGGVLMRGGIH